MKNYSRPEEQTILTLPEWYIVFSSEEWRDHLNTGRPSGFPFFSSIGQFWKIYGAVIHATRGRYPINWGYHLMNGVIGVSLTAEYLIKGLYENTFGGLTEWIEGSPSAGKRTSEDDFNRRWNQEYVTFIRLKPWYEFSFWTRLGQLWSLPAAPEASRVRRWERRFSLSLEFLGKSAWAWIIEKAAKGTYGPEDENILVWIEAPASPAWKSIEGVRVVENLGRHQYLISLPRYEPFTSIVPKLAAAGVEFVEIAGNRNLLITWIVSEAAAFPPASGDLLTQWRVLTAPGKMRKALLVTAPDLSRNLRDLPKIGGALDHLFDY